MPPSPAVVSMLNPVSETDLPTPTFLSLNSPAAVPVSVTVSLPKGVATTAPVTTASVLAL